LQHLLLPSGEDFSDVLGGTVEGSDDFDGLREGADDGLAGVHYDLIDGFVYRELKDGPEFLSDLRHVLI
jgi:hypothetical protein